MASVVKDLDVGVLVNNVGVSYPFPKFFHELTDEHMFNFTMLVVIMFYTLFC